MTQSHREKMNRFKEQLLFIILIVFSGYGSFAQSITLKHCYEGAEELSLVARQRLYYESIAKLQVENARKLNFPSVKLNGQATYQSDVFALPFSGSNLETAEIPKDQYRVGLSLQQTIYDGHLSRLTRRLAEAEAKVNQQQVGVELYQLRNLINSLFFGALITQENEKILDSLKVLLQEQSKEVESRVKNGVLLASNANILKKEILNNEQQLIIIKSDKEALLQMLGRWIGQEIPITAMLEIPELENFVSMPVAINRPEIELFNLQSQQISASRTLASRRNYPRISAFMDGGVAQPNPYNFFETDFSEFYMAGIKLQWNILDWGNNKNNLKILDLQKNIVVSKRDDFERQVTISLQKERSDIQKFEALIKKDSEILALQNKIVKESFAQLKNGLITSTQYITEVNNETRTRLNARIHELNLIQAKVNLLDKSGNF